MKPIILDYAIERKEDKTPAFYYDYSESLNKIVLNGEKRIFIDLDSNDVSLYTESRASGEGYDMGVSILEMETKTFSSRERDD